MAGMELVDGVYYTPEDLAKRREREAAAEARREAAARDIAGRTVAAQIDVSDDRIRAILTELLEPIVEAIEDLDARVQAVEPAGGAQGDDSEAARAEVPEGEGSAADEAAGADSGGAPAKAATRKAVKK